MKLYTYAGMMAAICALGFGCSDDDDDDTDGVGGTGGVGGTAGTAGTAGSATGGSATGGTGGSATGGSATGGSATGGSATGGSATGGTGGTAGTGGTGDAGLPTDQCLGEEDAWAASYPVPDAGMATVTDIARGCGVQCLAAADSIECTNDCIQDALPQNAISADCTRCAAYSVDCFIRNCAAVCAADPMAQACVACGCGDNDAGENCIQDYSVACSGIPNTEFCAGVN